MPTIPDDAALQELWVGWSLDVVEPGPRPDRPVSRGTASTEKGGSAEARSGEPVPAAAAPEDQHSCVGKLMRTPAALSEHASLGALAKLFALGAEGPVVIISDEKKPLGILTPAHVLRMVNRRPAEELERVRLRAIAMPSGLIAQTAPVSDAAERFAAEDCDTLVVVKPDGELAGVLMARDLCRLCV
jgi:signal-transduction protein with cAMP-binding, CBS, and nucleotidyltransferase domain